MKDEWLRAAMEDDKMVAELLLRLKQSDPHPATFTRQAGAAVADLLAALPPFDWGKRHLRSKAAAAASASAGKKDRERTRRSPTTPLSWSACGVGSGGAGCGASPSDGYEDSSRPSDRLVSAVRSKAAAANETTTSTKRPRRKKTFAELKEEESFLIKDRTLLKKELDALRIKLDEQTSLNEKLKRIKLDLHVNSQPKSVSSPNKQELQEQKNNHCQMEASTSSTTPMNSNSTEPASDSHNTCAVQTEASVEKASFVLPDLNMMPEDDAVHGKTLGRR